MTGSEDDLTEMADLASFIHILYLPHTQTKVILLRSFAKGRPEQGVMTPNLLKAMSWTGSHREASPSTRCHTVKLFHSKNMSFEPFLLHF
jgi:hypothetical protein